MARRQEHLVRSPGEGSQRHRDQERSDRSALGASSIRISTFVAGAGLAAALAACSAARLEPSAPRAEHPVASPLSGYLAPGALPGRALLGPPPAEGTPAWRADRDAYERTRALAGSPRWEQAVVDNDLWTGGALKRYACVLGKEISPQATPATWRLLSRMEKDVRTVGTPPKDFYNRTRPPIGDDRPICVKREAWLTTNASYPSGHSMAGWAWGLVLAELAPDKADGLVEAGRAIGDSRIVCGVHYPSDVEAGRTLGAAMVARLHAEPQFQRDLAAARTELAKAQAPATQCPASSPPEVVR